MFLNSFNYFRGLTIVTIVAGHCYGLSAYAEDTWLQRLVINLVSGNAALFVFISGFLFYHVFYPRYQYKHFLRKKFLYVLLPYLILSILPTYEYVFHNSTGHHHDFGIESPVVAIIFYYLTGATLVPYWYIPFIMIMFVLSPLFMNFIHATEIQKRYFLLFTAIIAMLVHRPIDLINPFQSVVYYIPVYSFGIWCAMNQEKLYKFWQNKVSILGAIVLSLGLYQAVFYTNTGNFHKAMFEFSILDINFAQKIFLALFFMMFFHRFEERPLPLGLSEKLSFLATYSFPIYFLHDMVIWVLDKYIPPKLLSALPWYLDFSLVVITVTTLSLLAAMLLKRLSGKYSRYVIGG